MLIFLFSILACATITLLFVWKPRPREKQSVLNQVQKPTQERNYATTRPREIPIYDKIAMENRKQFQAKLEAQKSPAVTFPAIRIPEKPKQHTDMISLSEKPSSVIDVQAVHPSTTASDVKTPQKVDEMDISPEEQTTLKTVNPTATPVKPSLTTPSNKTPRSILKKPATDSMSKKRVAFRSEEDEVDQPEQKKIKLAKKDTPEKKKKAGVKRERSEQVKPLTPATSPFSREEIKRRKSSHEAPVEPTPDRASSTPISTPQSSPSVIMAAKEHSFAIPDPSPLSLSADTLQKVMSLKKRNRKDLDFSVPTPTTILRKKVIIDPKDVNELKARTEEQLKKKPISTPPSHTSSNNTSPAVVNTIEPQSALPSKNDNSDLFSAVLESNNATIPPTPATSLPLNNFFTDDSQVKKNEKVESKSDFAFSLDAGKEKSTTEAFSFTMGTTEQKPTEQATNGFTLDKVSEPPKLDTSAFTFDVKTENTSNNDKSIEKKESSTNVPSTNAFSFNTTSNFSFDATPATNTISFEPIANSTITANPTTTSTTTNPTSSNQTSFVPSTTFDTTFQPSTSFQLSTDISFQSSTTNAFQPSTNTDTTLQQPSTNNNVQARTDTTFQPSTSFQPTTDISFQSSTTNTFQPSTNTTFQSSMNNAFQPPASTNTSMDTNANPFGTLSTTNSFSFDSQSSTNNAFTFNATDPFASNTSAPSIAPTTTNQPSFATNTTFADPFNNTSSFVPTTAPSTTTSDPFQTTSTNAFSFSTQPSSDVTSNPFSANPTSNPFATSAPSFQSTPAVNTQSSFIANFGIDAPATSNPSTNNPSFNAGMQSSSFFNAPTTNTASFTNNPTNSFNAPSFNAPTSSFSVQPNMQPNIQSNMQPNIQPNMQPNVPANPFPTPSNPTNNPFSVPSQQPQQSFGQFANPFPQQSNAFSQQPTQNAFPSTPQNASNTFTFTPNAQPSMVGNMGTPQNEVARNLFGSPTGGMQQQPSPFTQQHDGISDFPQRSGGGVPAKKHRPKRRQ